MPSQIQLENSRENRCSLRRAKLPVFCFFVILFFCVVKGAMAAPVIVQEAANAASGTANSFSVSFPKNTIAGDLIVVGFDFPSTATASSLTDSQGNTFTQVGTQLTSPGGDRSLVFYAKKIKGGADTVTVNFSANSAYIELYLTEYSGVNQTNPIDAQAGASGNAGPVSSGNATTTLAGDAIYGYCAADWACTAGSGFAAQSTFNDNLIEGTTVGNPGVYAATGSATKGWTMQMVALKPASAVASLSPSTLTFASQAVGVTSPAQTLTLKNTGTAALTLTSLALTGANASHFAQTNTCGASVAAGANCTASVTFTPAAGGALTAAVTLTDNATGSPQTVSLIGTGTSAVANLSPSTLTFASQAVGVTSAAQTLTLKNTGTAALTLTSLALTGTNASYFAQTNTCGASVAAGANCTVSVTFTPPASGALTAAITLTDNATGSPQTVSLIGTGTSAVASLSPSTLTFASQAVGVTSAPQTLTLKNTGIAALTLTSLALTGTNASYFAQTNTCGASVAAGASCTVSVTFTPPASGALTAAITLTDNATGSPQTVSLTGTGTAAVANLSPSSLTFVSQAVGVASAAQTLTLSNTGTAALNLTSLALSGADPADFAQTNTCGSSVAAGANCTISVTFKPAVSGALSATVTLADNATGSPQTVSFSGTGTSAGTTAGISPSSLTFGNESVDMASSSQVVTLDNTGSAALSITSVAFNGANPADFTEVNNCSPSVAAGGNCTIAVLFTPTASGAGGASLTITDNASGGPQSVSLSGTGTHDVILTWTASTTPGVVGYNVYRGTTSGGESTTPLNSSPINGTTYGDENVTAGAMYYYVVMSVASNDVTLSAASNEVSATVPSP